jgi:hypothetical protein
VFHCWKVKRGWDLTINLWTPEIDYDIVASIVYSFKRAKVRGDERLLEMFTNDSQLSRSGKLLSFKRSPWGNDLVVSNKYYYQIRKKTGLPSRELHSPDRRERR